MYQLKNKRIFKETFRHNIIVIEWSGLLHWEYTQTVSSLRKKQTVHLVRSEKIVCRTN